MKTILITGAAGFIGTHTCAAFSEAGWRVVGTDRVGPSWPLKGGEFEICDLLDGVNLKALAKKADPSVILHLGAETRVNGLTEVDYAVNTVGVQNVIDAANASAGCERVVFASTRLICPVYSPGTHIWDYRPPNLYGASKVEGEKIVRFGNLRKPWVMVRPTGIWGPGFRSPSYRDFFVQIRRGRYFHINGIHPMRTFGYVGNTAYQLLCLANAPLGEVSGSVHFLGDYEPLQVRSWADVISKEFGRRPLPSLPWFAARGASLTGDLLLKCGVNSFPLNSSRLRNMTADSIYDMQDLKGLAPELPFSLEQGTRLTVRWMEEGEMKHPVS